MDTLQSALNKVLLDAPHQAFATTIAEKLAAQGVTLTTREHDRLAEYLAGPSNAGLADPGHSAAISLRHVSTALGLIQPTLDSLVVLRILARLEDEVGEAFIEAHRQLADDVS